MQINKICGTYCEAALDKTVERHYIFVSMNIGEEIGKEKIFLIKF